jgi:hypothetical protein
VIRVVEAVHDITDFVNTRKELQKYQSI